MERILDMSTRNATSRQHARRAPAFRAALLAALVAAGAGVWGQGIAVDRIELTRSEDGFEHQVTLLKSLQGDRYQISVADPYISGRAIDGGRHLSGLVAFSIDNGATWRLYSKTGSIETPNSSELALIANAYATSVPDPSNPTLAVTSSSFSMTPSLYGMETSGYSIALFDDDSISSAPEVYVASSIRFRIPPPSIIPSTPSSIKILFIVGERGKARSILMNVVPEHFKGERALFTASSKLTRMSYQEKATILLGTLFSGEASTDYRAYAKDKLPFWGGFTDWGVFDSVPGFAQAKENLLAVLAADFVDATVGEPVSRGAKEFLIPTTRRVEGMFDTLYGGNRSPYHSAYVGFLFTKNWPLYAGLIKEELNSGGVVYSPGDFVPISQAQGVELAKAALRYYTWGLEYTNPDQTPDDGFDNRFLDVEGGNVYSSNIPLVMKWIDDPIAGNTSYKDPLVKDRFTRNFMPLRTDGSDPIMGVLIYPTYLVKAGENVVIPSLPYIQSPLLTTPYFAGQAGKPLPYLPGGIDTPRTFAFKLVQALKMRTTLFSTTPWLSSTQSQYQEEWESNPTIAPYHTISEALVKGKKLIDPTDTKESASLKNGGVTVVKDEVTTVYKPFGIWNFSINQAPDAFAGVDALGLLTGAISMTSFSDEVEDLTGIKKGAAFGAYSGFTKGNPGLDADGKPIALADGDLRSLTEGNYSFSRADLEKITCIVPDLSMLRVGDILVDFGSGERIERVDGAVDQSPGRQPLHIGIIIGFSGPLPIAGSDPTDRLKNVLVLSIREGFRQVTVGSWGNPSTGFGGFTDDPKRYQARRLLVSGGSASTVADWDILDSSRNRFELTIGGYKEHSSSITTNERWIPNTGEYLQIEGLHIFPRGGISPTQLKDYYIPRIAGLSDRGWRSDETWDTSGNIWRNKGEGFDLMIKPVAGFNNAVGIKLLTFKRQDGPDYLVDFTGSAVYNPDGSFKPGWSAEFVSLAGESSVEVSFKNGGVYYDTLGIRPISAAQAYPGDDIRIQIEIVKKSSGVVIATARAQDKDYFAVYDKKLLWRANLYLRQNEATLGNGDWNDVHPWNAPPLGTVQVRNAADEEVNASIASAWWSESWGHNEWNRKHDPSSEPPLSVFTGINELPIGNGGQVIEIASFARFYGGGGTTQGAVAYSFPGHHYEPNYSLKDDKPVERYMRYVATYNPGNGAIGGRGNAGSMDSPFDFNRKLISQLELRRLSNPLSPMVPATGWNGYSTAMPDGVAEADTKPETFTAPAPDTGTLLSASATRAFIPGLGLWYLKHDYNTDASWERRGSWILEAGTDCIGFANRAASYSGNGYTEWVDLDEGWTEGNGIANIWNQLNSYSGTRVYPRTTTDQSLPTVTNAKSYEIFRRESINFSDIIDEDEYSNEKEKISRIVPGDIFYYYPGHIAIVAEVIYVDGVVDNIRLIEATYGWLETNPAFAGARVSRVIKDRLLKFNYLVDADGALQPTTRYSIVRLKK
ncbi:MAG: hypothetical protein JXA15_13905 [Spirochaetales bacterium]|nr:hypothetical protein [Spirochaetales bacterium]